MTAVQVGHDFLSFTPEIFDSGDRQGVIIDSGTTLAYLPEMVYEPLVSKVCDIKLVYIFQIVSLQSAKVLHFFLFNLWLDTFSAA